MANATKPMLPKGLRIYAVGDVHGRYDLLRTMAAKIKDDLAQSPPDRALEIYIGDYIDRGPRSRDVVEWLIETPPLGSGRICLMGNHEEMLLEALAASGLTNWLHNGAEATLASYGIAPLPTSLDATWEAFMSAVPLSHQTFFSGLPRTVEFGSYFFVHAGIDPRRSLAKQEPQDLLWIREPFLSSDANFGRIIVHGHTPVEEPDIRENRINIDTGAVFTGRLTCLVLEGATTRLLQTPAEKRMPA